MSAEEKMREIALDWLKNSDDDNTKALRGHVSKMLSDAELQKDVDKEQIRILGLEIRLLLDCLDKIEAYIKRQAAIQECKDALDEARAELGVMRMGFKPCALKHKGDHE